MDVEDGEQGLGYRWTLEAWGQGPCPQRSVPTTLQGGQLHVICSLPLSCPQMATIRTLLNLARGGHPQASSKTQQPGTDAVLPFDPAPYGLAGSS